MVKYSSKRKQSINLSDTITPTLPKLPAIFFGLYTTSKKKYVVFSHIRTKVIFLSPNRLPFVDHLFPLVSVFFCGVETNEISNYLRHVLYVS